MAVLRMGLFHEKQFDVVRMNCEYLVADCEVAEGA
jgi:hypothetical protein